MRGIEVMPNNRLKKKLVAAYLPEEDTNVIKFFAADHNVSVSKLIEDSLYYLIQNSGDTFNYPVGGFKYDNTRTS